MAGLSVPYAFFYQVSNLKTSFIEENGTLDDFIQKEKDEVITLLNRYTKIIPQNCEVSASKMAVHIGLKTCR